MWYADNPDATWLVIVNVALALVVLGCAAWIGLGACREIAVWAWKRWRRRRFFIYDGHELKGR